MKLIFLLLPLLLNAFDPGSMPNESFTSNQCHIDSIVGNHVSVISGDFIDEATDLKLASSETFLLNRNYSSGSEGCWKIGFKDGWSFNQPNAFLIHDHRNVYLLYNGNCSQYSYPGNSFTKHAKPKLSNLNGLTNCTSPSISSQTNIKNLELTVHYHSEYLETGNGSVHKFWLATQNPFVNKIVNGSRWESVWKRPNGTSVEYSYECDTQVHLKQMKLQGPKGNYIGEFLIGYCNINRTNFCIQSSDGKKVCYTRDGHLLKNVNYSYKPSVEYQHNAKNKIQKKLWGDKKHWIEASYYHEGIQQVGGRDFIDGSTCLGKVKSLFIPSFADGGSAVGWMFFYKNKNLTEVYDSVYNKRAYHINDQMRITRTEKFLGRDPSNYKLYSSECYNWGPLGTAQEGNIWSKWLEDGSGKVYVANHYVYDQCKQNNLFAEMLCGNLSGQAEPLQMVNGNAVGGEKYHIWHKYSPDNFNNLIELTEDNGKQFKFTYYPNTNLRHAKYFIEKGQIKVREFLTYDADTCAVSKKVIDDGTALSEHDLTGVTHRYITNYSIHTVAPVGLPNKIDQLALDIKTGEEVLLNSTYLYYLSTGEKTKELVFAANGHLISSKSWEYDQHGNEVSYTDPLGQVTTKHYDINDRLIYEQGPDLRVHKEYVYDCMDRVVTVKEINSDGSVFTLQNCYDLLGNKTSSIDTYGNTTTFVYDELNRIVKTIYPPIDGEAPVVVIDYDILNNPIAKTDPKGFTTQTAYNSRGNPIEITYPNGTCEKFTYNLDGTLKESINVNGLSTKFTYDVIGRCTSKEEYGTDGRLLSQETSEFGGFHLLRSVDAEGNESIYEYDIFGRQSGFRKGSQRKTFEYDCKSRLIKSYDWVDSTTAMVHIKDYDPLDRVVEERIEDLKGQVHTKRRFSYDSAGRMTHAYTYTEQEGVTITEYNPQDLPIKITDQLGNVTRYDYNFSPHFEKITTDPLGQVTRELYDPYQKLSLLTKYNPYGVQTFKQELFYDLNKNLIRVVDYTLKDGEVLKTATRTLSYDCLNNMVEHIEAVGTSEQRRTVHKYNSKGQKAETIKPDGKSLHYTYNEKGLLTYFKGSDDSFAYRYFYDKLGKPLEITDEFSGTSNYFTYDALGNVISETLNSGLSISKTYDALGRVINLVLPDRSTIEYFFNPVYLSEIRRNGLSHKYLNFNLSGQVTAAELMSRSTILYGMDQMGKLKSFSSPSYSEKNFYYDASGHLKTYLTQDSLGEERRNYGYDDLYQLSSENDHTYTHDSLNNRLSKDNDIYTINVLNQITARNNTSYEYDENGNLARQITPEKTTSYTYDALDRLTRINETTYTYDSFNRRISQTRNGHTQYFIYNNQDEIGLFENGQITQLRVLGLSKGAEIGGTVLLEIDGQTLVPIHDHVGNIVSLLDLNNNPIATYRYTAFGELKHATDHPNPYLYSSKRFDPETGLYHFGRRFYDPIIGRWITPDPIGYDDGPNLYAYVHNSPLAYNDLYGLNSTSRDYSEWGEADHYMYTYDHYKSSSRETDYNHDNFFSRCWESFKNFIPDSFKMIAHGAYNLCTWKRKPTEDYANNKNCFNRTEPCIEVFGTVFDERIGFKIYTNGINNTLEEARENAKYLSDRLGGYEVILVYNGTNGLLLDLARTFTSQLGNIASSAVPTLHKVFDIIYMQNPNAKITLIAHSEGAINAKLALKSYDREKVKTMNYIGVAPAGYLPKGLTKNAVYLTSKNDFVHFNDFKGYIQCFDQIKILSRDATAKFWDHDFKSKTYEKSIISTCESFVDEG